jgi:hypothetical protein
LHGMLSTQFTSSFWRVLFRLQGKYLRCYAGAKPKAWSVWLTLFEWWYNTSHHFSTRYTPFEAVYGYAPPTLLFYV